MLKGRVISIITAATLLGAGCSAPVSPLVGKWKYQSIKITGWTNPKLTSAADAASRGFTITFKADNKYTLSDGQSGVWSINDNVVTMSSSSKKGVLSADGKSFTQNTGAGFGLVFVRE